MILLDDLTPNQLDFFLKYLWNGVGSDNYIKPPAFVFREASKFHDFASWRGGKEVDRIAASNEFFHKMHDMIRIQPWRKRPLYYLLAYIYYRILEYVDSCSWSYSDRPANDWNEFIQAVRDYYISVKKPIPEYLRDAEKIV